MRVYRGGGGETAKPLLVVHGEMAPAADSGCGQRAWGNSLLFTFPGEQTSPTTKLESRSPNTSIHVGPYEI